MKTKHFDKKIDKKLTCLCCPDKDVLPEVYILLELIRNHFNQPVIITSGYRCPDYNKSIGGRSKSQHMQGKAVDIVVKNISSKKVHDFLDNLFPNSLGLGYYPDFTHVDIRSYKARW